jgi:serine-type D-Ala-D-Ala carboxypeptidase/endopeptidase (penicillin-binding protein 4)
MFQRFAPAVLLAAALTASGGAVAQGVAPALPAEVQQALQRAEVGTDAIAVVLHDAATGRRVLQWQEQRPLNPASLAKLITTTAALERLGPAFTWATPVWLGGPIRNGVLEGPLHIKGSGDPKLVIERLWLMLRRVQQMGVRDIRGDIVLDNSAFAVPDAEPGDFDGETRRPYNVQPSALLLNYRSAIYTFVPDETTNVARVLAEPPLAGVQVERTVPLVAGPCGDWRAALKGSFEPNRTRFGGFYPAACGEQIWPVADVQPASFDARLLQGLWQEMGGRFTGTVREGPAPLERKPSFELRSEPLSNVVRDINKFSNNVMAQQLFYTLAAQEGRVATPAAAREVLLRWLAERTGELTPDVVLDNGSGLSRSNRISAARLARLLQQALEGPIAGELMASLPISGLDGTLRRSRATPGRALLKTGSLRDVAGVAGYVHATSGKRYVLVAMINHPNANAARPALDALVQWAMRDAPAQSPAATLAPGR